MQISDWRSERSLLWLLVAMVSTLVADLLWVNAELRQDSSTSDLLFDEGARFGGRFGVQLAPIPYVLHDLIFATFLRW